MNLINGAFTALFDILLVPLEAVGTEFSLIMVSGVFGILALIVFKHISSQRGIKATKDKIKGHMIEIRLYQNDLGLVSKAIAKVLFRNTQYVAYNFGPFIPLALPFAFVVAQMVVRYGFEPLEVQQATLQLAGEGTTVKIHFTDDGRADADQLRLVLPDGIAATSKFFTAADGSFACQEIVATRDGEFDLVISSRGQEYVKKLHAGKEAPRSMQGERVTGLSAILWPAEDTFPSDSGIAKVVFVYPESDLGWLPGSGPIGVILVFLVASMGFGIVMLKPLGVQI